MKKLTSSLALAAAATLLAACNTVAGIGEDITSASQGVQNEIQKNRTETDETAK